MTSGDVAPLYMFFNGPAANPFNNCRISIYGVGGTPTVKMDGLASGYTPSSYPSMIASRLADPCYLDIDVSMAGDSTGGTAYVNLTAEQDLGVTGTVKVWCVIVEDNQLAAGTSWGGYNGMTLNWLPVAWPLGAVGTVVSFTGPYPQTINLAHSYTLTPSIHTFANLRVITFVQPVTGTVKEVLNAHYMDLPDATGIEDPVDPGALPEIDLQLWPNPCRGTLSVGSAVPAGSSGVISIFDISGRLVTSFEASTVDHVEITEPGVYLARLVASGGLSESARFTVVR